MPLRKIRPEDDIEFRNLDQLSYEDNGGNNVKLYVDNIYIGNIKIWEDEDMNDREYICLNYEKVYLDGLKNI